MLFSIQEYNVRASSNNDKNYFIGRFISGLPNFSKKKSENKWSLQKEGLQGRQVTDTLRVMILSKYLFLLSYSLDPSAIMQLYGFRCCSCENLSIIPSTCEDHV